VSGRNDAGQWYWVAFDCPACSSLVRATTVLRGWEARPTAVVEPLALVTRSQGPGKIENLRWPLDEYLRAMPRDQRCEAARRIGDFFSRLERRMFDGAHAARQAASRVRLY
jgi:hypothetical protein